MIEENLGDSPNDIVFFKKKKYIYIQKVLKCNTRLKVENKMLYFMVSQMIPSTCARNCRRLQYAT